jgi:formamidopyrimidine-DNA glycosylase
MPELPEVQTVVDELGHRLTGRQFADGATFLWSRTAGYPDAAVFGTRLSGRTVVKMRRRAKYIIAELDNGELFVTHLRMTGNLHFARPGDPDHRYLRARLPLVDGGELRFADMRKFGRLYLGTLQEISAVTAIGRLGPEPLETDFTVDVLRESLTRRRGAVKAALLDQSVVSGLGNIYVDEALFRARIDPRRAAGSLSERDLQALHAGIGAALRQALANGGTSFRDYLSVAGARGENEPNLQVFRHHGEPCPRCGDPLQRIVVAGRGTHFCPRCQV